MCKFATTTHSDDPAQASIPTDLSFIPSNEICRKAYDHCAAHLHPSILNHSIRTFLHAKHILALPPSVSGLPTSLSKDHPYAETPVFIAALFHDMGTIEELNGPERFEICGADAAVDFLKQHAPETHERDVHNVWTAIACHSTPGIAERIGALARMLRLAVLVDFDRRGLRAELKAVELSTELEGRWPRMNIERVLGDAVVEQVMRKAEGAERGKKAPPGSWVGDLLRGWMEMRAEGVEGVNRYF